MKANFMILHFSFVVLLYLLAVGEESTLESFPLETCGKALLLVVFHIIVHADGIVSVNVAFLHHLVHRTKDLQDTFPIYRKQYCFRLFPHLGG